MNIKEDTTEGNERKLPAGSKVYVEFIVDRVPRGDTRLYRLVQADNGSVIWTTSDQMIVKNRGEYVKAKYVR